MRSGSVAVFCGALCIPGALAGTNEFGRKFLAENKKKDGVIELPSGLQYKVLREGDGETHPLVNTQCECHYEGRTAQEFSKEPKGKKFDSSYDRGSPTAFAPSGVIKGWTEAMQLMVEGDKWEMYIPSELGYGDSGQGGDIGAGDVLVFTMEIIKIKGESKPANRGPPPYDEVAGSAELDEWAKKQEVPLVLGLFRTPTVGKLFDSFRGAARQFKKNGKAATAFNADSVYDAKAKAYTKTKLEEALKIRAPGVYVSGAAGGKWTKCKTGHQQNSVSVDEIKESIAGCVAAAKGAKDEL